MSSDTARVTTADVGRRFTYDGGQVLRVMQIDTTDGTIGMGKRMRRMTVARLQALLDSGRAVWGDWGSVDGIIRASGGRVDTDDYTEE